MAITLSSSNLQQITNIMFDETKHILSHGSAYNATVKCTTDARNVCLLPIHKLKDSYATRQLHCQWRSSPRRAKCPANTFQFVNAVYLRLMQSLLNVTTYLVIDRTEVGAIPIRQPKIWRNEGCVDCSRNHTVLHAQCAGVCLFERWRNCLTYCASQATAAVKGARHGNSRCWYSPSNGLRWGPWGQASRCRWTP